MQAPRFSSSSAFLRPDWPLWLARHDSGAEEFADYSVVVFQRLSGCRMDSEDRVPFIATRTVVCLMNEFVSTRMMDRARHHRVYGLPFGI